jgi:hypothetical protein
MVGALLRLCAALAEKRKLKCIYKEKNRGEIIVLTEAHSLCVDVAKL